MEENGSATIGKAEDGAFGKLRAPALSTGHGKQSGARKELKPVNQ
jgi:hypothetical protein